MERLEKTLYHDGIAFMRYTLEYPSGEEFLFAEEMTRGYAAYLEEDYFAKLCALYDADSERRKRYRHKLVYVTQRYKLYQEERMISLCFHVSENEHSYAFAFTWDKAREVLLRPCDFGVNSRRLRKKNCIYCDGAYLHIFSKKGEVVEKIPIDRRIC